MASLHHHFEPSADPSNCSLVWVSSTVYCQGFLSFGEDCLSEQDLGLHLLVGVSLIHFHQKGLSSYHSNCASFVLIAFKVLSLAKHSEFSLSVLTRRTQHWSAREIDWSREGLRNMDALYIDLKIITNTLST